MSNDLSQDEVLTRAALVGSAMKFLGPERERVAELAADALMNYKRELNAHGSFITSTAGKSVEQLEAEMKQHFEQFAVKAWGLMVRSMLTGLEAASYQPRG